VNEALEGLGDHAIFELLKEQDADAWELVYRDVVLAEARSLRSAEAARKWGVASEELMSILYEDMIGKGRINHYRDDGGSLQGWLRKYVRGYVFKANPELRREVSLDSFGKREEDEDGDFVEKVSFEVSESRGKSASLAEDPVLRRREDWGEVQKCFGELWRKSPLKAYVHLLKLRLNLSSKEIKEMLGISSEANVDQLFSRAVKEMRELRDEDE